MDRLFTDLVDYKSKPFNIWEERNFMYLKNQHLNISLGQQFGQTRGGVTPPIVKGREDV